MTKEFRYIVDLSISADEYLAYYQQRARNISVRDLNNKLIVFPANQIQKFLTHSGIHGRFELVCDDNNRFVRMTKLE